MPPDTGGATIAPDQWLVINEMATTLQALAWGTLAVLAMVSVVAGMTVVKNVWP